MAQSSCLPLENQPNRDRWEEEQRRAGAFRVERAAALLGRGIVNFVVNNVRSFSAVCCTDKPLWFVIAQKADTLNSIWVQL